MTLAAPLNTTPRTWTMATSESSPLGFDPTPLLLPGQNVASVSSVLTDLDDDSVIELLDEPTIAENVITQIVRGSELVATHQYQLAVTVTVDDNTVWTMLTTIIVPL